MLRESNSVWVISSSILFFGLYPSRKILAYFSLGLSDFSVVLEDSLGSVDLSGLADQNFDNLIFFFTGFF